MNATTDLLPLRQTATPAPPRLPGSIRRTSSIDVSWPDGHKGARLFIGTVRDYRTPDSGGPGETMDEARFEARLDGQKTIVSILAEPSPARLGELVGARAGNHLRVQLRELMPELVASAAPLYLPLDDLSGTALVSTFAWAHWYSDQAESYRKVMPTGEIDRLLASRVDVCWGLQAGNSGVTGDLRSHVMADADAGDLRNPADPEGWHEFSENEGPGFRRARRIDVKREGGVIRIVSGFQDSANTKTGGRVAIHEYELDALVDAGTLKILELTPRPHVLPFRECPGAVANIQRLVGKPIDGLRGEVLSQLRGPEGCTHLNDALRALADTPRLIEQA